MIECNKQKISLEWKQNRKAFVQTEQNGYVEWPHCRDPWQEVESGANEAVKRRYDNSKHLQQDLQDSVNENGNQVCQSQTPNERGSWWDVAPFWDDHHRKHISKTAKNWDNNATNVDVENGLGRSRVEVLPRYFWQGFIARIVRDVDGGDLENEMPLLDLLV